MKLSILICTLPNREEMMLKLYHNLNSQRATIPYDIQVSIDDNEFDSIGEKRNRLLKKAIGEYVCFIDDDDRVSDNYIQSLIGGINKGVDCCSLKGEYSVDGKFDGIFEHSLLYKEWKTTTNEIKYERYPNHLNCIKASIAKQFKFPETNWGEDHDWSKQIHESGLISTEYYIKDILYYYDKKTK